MGNLVQGIQRLGLGGGLLLALMCKPHFNVTPQITDTEAAVLFREYRNLFLRHRRLPGRMLAEKMVVKALAQNRQYIRMMIQKFVIDRSSARIPTETALTGRDQAHHADNISGIGMQGEFGAVLIGTVTGVVAPKIHHVPQPVPGKTLGLGLSHVRTDAPENKRAVIFGITLDRKPVQ